MFSCKRAVHLVEQVLALMICEERRDVMFLFVCPLVSTNLYLEGVCFRVISSLTWALALPDQALLARVGGVVGVILVAARCDV